MRILALLGTLLGAWFSLGNDNIVKIWEWAKKNVGGVIKAIGVIAVAFVGMIPKFFDAVSYLTTMLNNLGAEFKPFNEADPFNSAPGYALRAVNAIVPLDTVVAGILTVGALWVALLSANVARKVIWLTAKIKQTIWPT